MLKNSGFLLASIRLFARAAREVPFLTICSFTSQYKTHCDNDGRQRDPSEHSHDAKFFAHWFPAVSPPEDNAELPVILPRFLYPKHSLPRRERAAIADNARIAGGLALLTECGVFDDILQPNYSRAAELHQVREKKDTATADSRAHIALQDSIVSRPSKKTAHNKAQLEKLAQCVRFRWHSLDLAESNPQRI